MKGIRDVELRFADRVVSISSPGCQPIGKVIRKLQWRKLWSDDLGVETWTEWEDVPYQPGLDEELNNE